MSSLNTSDLYIRFLDQASILFFIISKNGIIHKTNLFTKQQLGSHIEGESFESIILDFYNTFDLSKINKNLDSIYPLNIKRATGMPQTFYFRFEPIEDVIYAFGELDSDELETIRKEIFSLNNELNNLTRELHKKNAQLEMLNQEKNQFLGMAAHDLRKPIGLIMSYAEFLIDEVSKDLDDEHIGFLNTIKKSSGFMKRLVDDFLDVSAIEAGKFDLDLQPAFITDILNQSLLLNNLQAMKKGIDLSIEADRSIPRLLVDTSKVEQVITNLVSNAIEHTQPDTRVTIHLKTNETHMLFSVTDKGPGIAPEEMGKLFQPFEKTSTKKTGGEKSTGLGMLITRKIIEAHRGDIWVESDFGKGTRIFFTLPYN